MEHYLCTTCGTQYAPSFSEPDQCLICEDERQYVNWHGQSWTTMAALSDSYSNTIRQLEPNLYGISIEPTLGIGQRALLVRSAGGNVLWDCLPLIDEATIRFIEQLGGLKAIAISHPHFYGSMVEWSKAFGKVPVYIHAADRDWVMRPAEEINFWEGDRLPLWDDMQLIRCGGHYPGSSVMHYGGGGGGRGALFTSDTLQVTMDRRYVSFMQSFPNLIPLSGEKVIGIAHQLQDVAYDRIYGGWFERNILSNAKEAVEQSVHRYLRAIGQQGIN